MAISECEPLPGALPSTASALPKPTATAEATEATAQQHSCPGQPLHPTALSPSSSHSVKAVSPPASTDVVVGPHRVKPIPKPTRDVKKNSVGLYPCTWPDCSEEIRHFPRKCEYNKHMDKHERPYRCTAEGCEKLPGFTYSGGLLRHEREVHGKHGGPRNPLHCPHPTCKRHSGKGFSRQENLNEHLRRVHTTATTPTGAAAGATPTTLPPDALLNSGLLNMSVIWPLASALPGGGQSPVSGDHNANNVSNPSASVLSPDGRDVDLGADADDDAEAMESLGLLLPTRGRKRRATSPLGDAGVVGAGGGDEEGLATTSGHSSESQDLREEMERVRQENEELRRRVEEQKHQILAMLQQNSCSRPHPLSTSGSSSQRRQRRRQQL